MTRAEETRPVVSAHAIDAVLRRARPSARRVAPGVIFGVLADFAAVGLLALSMWLIVRSGEQPPILHLTFAIVGVRAFAIGRAALRYADRLAGHDAALRQLATIRTTTFEALIPRVPGAIETRRRGDVLATFVDDVDRLQDEPLRVRQPLIVSTIVVGLSVLVVALIAPVAGLILAGTLAIAGWISAWLSNTIAGESDRRIADAQAALADALLERVSAAETLAAYGALGWQRERIAAAEQRVVNAQLRRTRAAGVTGALVSLGAGVASLLTLLALGPVAGAAIAAPLFAAIVIVPAAVFEVFAQVPVALSARRTVAASAARVAALTEGPLPVELPIDPPTIHATATATADAPDAPADPDASAPPRDPAWPDERLLEVRGLEVRHPGAEAPAVAGLSFALNAGETLVITGDSGAGKSTLALALVKLLGYAGSYRVRAASGVREVSDLSGAELRSLVGLCEQQPHLFDADVRQNLKFAQETASDSDLEAVLQRVGLGEWLRARGGLDARVGERGALVSGGQAQRIALARAILADFPIVILDEPTAGVDRERADRLLGDLLGAVPDDRAVILITHTDLPAGVEVRHLAL